MRIAVALLVVLSVFACADAPTPGPVAGDVPHPDTARLAPAVAERIDAARRDAEAGDDPDAWGRLGMVYQAHDLDAAARAAYARALAGQPDAVDWNYYAGLLEARAGDHDAARARFGRVLDAVPDDAATWHRLGEMALADNDLDEAERAYGNALASDPSSAAARFALGKIALERDDPPTAIAQLEAALAAAPRADAIHYTLALAHREAGDVDAARRHLELRGDTPPAVADARLAALRDLTGGTRVHTLRGTLLFEQGRHEAALAEFEAAVAAHPDDAVAHTNLGRTRAQLGDVDGARAAFERAVALAPDDAPARFNLGTLHARLGDDGRAIEQYRAALAVDPGMTDAHLNLANALRRRGRHADALPHYRAVVEGDPAHAGARLAEAYTLLRLGREADALERLERAHATLPDDLDVVNALARLLAGAGDPGLRDPRRAYELAQRLLSPQLPPDHAATLAMVAASLGRYREAAALQERVVRQVQTAGGDALLPALRADLERYRAGRPAERAWAEDHPLLSPSPSG